jgi:D-arabinono-1,4-lactone oxidase
LISSKANSSFDKIQWWIRFYSYITFAAIIYGIAAAHIPAILGEPWSSCESCDCKFVCVLVFHLYEVPLVAFNTFFAWYGLKRFSVITIHNYNSLLTFAIVSNLAFFTFESILLLDNVKSNAPAWESIALSSVALILVGGSGFGIFVKQKLISFIYQADKV